MFPTTSIFIKDRTKITKITQLCGELNYSFQTVYLYKKCFSTSVQAVFCPSYCKMHFFDKHKRTKNNLQIAFRQQTELPHPLLRSSSSKTTTIVREQRYTRIKYTCKAVHLQKIKSFGRGPEYPLMETPPFQLQ